MIEEQFRYVDRVLNPRLRDLPEKFRSFRPHQIEAIDRVVDAFLAGNRVVVLDAPTGSGKALIGETVRRIVGGLLGEPKALYVCSSKQLQDQFATDFPYARVLKGRGNYPTEKYPERFVAGEFDSLSADDCTWALESGCDWCSQKSSCPYEQAKTTALKASVAILNSSFYLAETNNVGKFDRKKWGDGLVVVDEADTLESALMNHVSVDISERRMERFGLYPPVKVSVPESWKEWLDNAIPVIRKYRSSYRDPVRWHKDMRSVERLLDSLLLIRRDLDREGNSWVYTGKGSEGHGRRAGNVGRAVSFKPARVDDFGDGLLWSHGARWLLMSATVISSQEMLDSLGYRGDDVVTVRVANTFPKQNRPVRVYGVAEVTAKQGQEAKVRVGNAVAEIVARHPGERVLVHTVSYDLARVIRDCLRSQSKRVSGGLPARPTIVYENAGEREKAIHDFLRAPGGVLIAPSLDRGLDLPDDACRVQIIAKVPFPYLGDKQISARLHSRGGQTWYNVQTVRTIVQMCGRAVRSETDFAVTYILDSAFKGQVWSRSRGLFPSWFVEAIDWSWRPQSPNGGSIG